MLTDIQAAFAAHNWLVLLMLVAVYARKLSTADSAFPVTIPVNWRPVVTGAFGVVIAVIATLQAGKGPGDAAIAGAAVGASTGVLDGLLMAIFGAAANAPSWAKAIVFIFDDVAGGGQAGKKGPGGGGAAAAVLLLACGVLFAGNTAACSPAAQQEAKTVINGLLSAADIACVELSQYDTAPEVAKDCNLVQQLTPELSKLLDILIAQRNAARKAGFAWPKKTAFLMPFLPAQGRKPRAAPGWLLGTRRAPPLREILVQGWPA